MEQTFKIYWISIAVFAVVFFGFVTPSQSRSRWNSECFGTIEAMTAKLSTLPDDVALSAKVVVAPSSRNVGGWVGTPYCLVTRR